VQLPCQIISYGPPAAAAAAGPAAAGAAGAMPLRLPSSSSWCRNSSPANISVAPYSTCTGQHEITQQHDAWVKSEANAAAAAKGAVQEQLTSQQLSGTMPPQKYTTQSRVQRTIWTKHIKLLYLSWWCAHAGPSCQPLPLRAVAATNQEHHIAPYAAQDLYPGVPVVYSIALGEMYFLRQKMLHSYLPWWCAPAGPGCECLPLQVVAPSDHEHQRLTEGTLGTIKAWGSSNNSRSSNSSNGSRSYEIKLIPQQESAKKAC
jgi:hypothetical protein